MAENEAAAELDAEAIEAEAIELAEQVAADIADAVSAQGEVGIEGATLTLLTLDFTDDELGAAPTLAAPDELIAEPSDTELSGADFGGGDSEGGESVGGAANGAGVGQAEFDYDGAATDADMQAEIVDAVAAVAASVEEVVEFLQDSQS
jgi:hypothetical protein